MAVPALGGGSRTPCAGVSVWQRRNASVLTAFLRAGANVHNKRRCFNIGDRTVPTRQAYTLASDAAVSGFDVRAGDLKDMCTLQLGMLFQLLSRAGDNYRSMRCTVYARNFTSVGPGQVKLVRIAQFPMDPGSNEELQAQQQLLLHTEQSWALQGGSAAVDPCAMIEDCLLQREVVALPSSSSLVFPLVDQQVLVGLLVVELEVERPRPEAPGLTQPQPQTQAGSTAAETGAAGTPAASSSAPHGAVAGHAAGPGPGGAAAHQWNADGAAAMASLERTACQVHSRPHRSLTDDELQCLRLAVPLLAKACGMDARASWQLAQSSVSAAAARGLLREAQRPLSALNTFGAMLVPRLKDGDPDKDMAKAVVVQGKRLQDLMWQLEDALHGAAAAGSGPMLAGLSPAGASMGMAGISMSGPSRSAQLSAPPFRSPTALPRDPSPAVQELLSLPQPRPVALSASQPHHQPSQSHAPAAADATPVEGSLQCRTPDTTAGPSQLESASPRFASGRNPPGAVLPGRVTFVDRSADTVAAGNGTSASPMDASSPPFTIRQPPAYATSSGSGGTAAAVSGARAASPHHPQSASVTTATIDVETDCSNARGQGGIGLSDRQQQQGSSQPAGMRGGVSGASWGWVAPQFTGSGSGQLAAVVSTNLASALAGVLTAAYRLAAVSGIGFIVNSPLSAVLPRRSGGAGAAASAGGAKARALPTAPYSDAAAGHGRSQGERKQGAGAAAASATDSGQTAAHAAAAAVGGGALPAGPRLIPRPARPLLVGVHAALVHKVVGYMLDIALQCTPRGGQVCVSARQDGAGVQVQVLHSGRLDLQRLHVRSRSMVHSSGAQASLATAAASVAQATASRAASALARHGGGHSGETAVAVATRPATAAATATAQAGSGVLSVEMAQELAQQAGGHLTVSYPYNMVNAQSGLLDVGTSVEIWLPGPGALN